MTSEINGAQVRANEAAALLANGGRDPAAANDAAIRDLLELWQLLSRWQQASLTGESYTAAMKQAQEARAAREAAREKAEQPKAKKPFLANVFQQVKN